jgi:hypothetical protein
MRLLILFVVASFIVGARTDLWSSVPRKILAGSTVVATLFYSYRFVR